MKFTGAQQDCIPCERREERLPTNARRGSFSQGKRRGPSKTDMMNKRIDSNTGRHMTTRRVVTVEPEFGNLRGNKQLKRITLCGKTKVDSQWKLYLVMHNIAKLSRHGYAVQ